MTTTTNHVDQLRKVCLITAILGLSLSALFLISGDWDGLAMTPLLWLPALFFRAVLGLLQQCERHLAALRGMARVDAERDAA